MSRGVFDLDAYVGPARAQLELRLAGVAPGQVLAFLNAASQETRNRLHGTAIWAGMHQDSDLSVRAHVQPVGMNGGQRLRFLRPLHIDRPWEFRAYHS